MPYYYGYGFGIDPLYLLVVLVCTVLGLAAQVQSPVLIVAIKSTQS